MEINEILARLEEIYESADKRANDRFVETMKEHNPYNFSMYQIACAYSKGIFDSIQITKDMIGNGNED